VPTVSTQGRTADQGAQGPRRLLDPDKRDRLIIALEGMTLNPNEGLIRAALGGIQGRRADRKRQEAMQQEQAAMQRRRNATAQWLRQQDRNDLADAVEGGAIDGKTAVGEAMKAGDQGTALMQNYRFLTGEVGKTPDEAFEIAQGGQTINVNSGPRGIDYGDPGQGLVWQRDAQGNVTVDERGAPIAIPYQCGQVYREQQQGVQESASERAKASERERQSRIKMGTTLQNIQLNVNELEDGGLPMTGPVGVGLGLIPATPQADFQNRTQQITTSAALNELQRMRENSPTGGAVGQLTDAEREAIGMSVTSLNNSSSQEEYLRQAKNFRQQMLDIAFKGSNWNLDPETGELIVTPGEGVTSNGDPENNATSIGNPPPGVSGAEWEAMSPEERALWQR